MTLLPQTAIVPVVASPDSAAGPEEEEVSGSPVMAAVEPPVDESAAPELVLPSAGSVVETAPELLSAGVLAVPESPSDGDDASSPGQAPRARERDSVSKERQASEVTRR